MRSPLEQQATLGQTPIEDIEFNPNSRDETSKLLRGLQALWCNTQVRDRVLALMEDAHREKVATDNGRPGMTFWEILTLGVVKQGLACDFDRLKELTDNHRRLRTMVGLSNDEHLGCYSKFQEYDLQTIVSNVSLLDKDLLDRINEEIVTLGHTLVGHDAATVLRGRADSYVVETDVEYPTDLRLLWDALRSAIKRSRRLSNSYGLAGWRQSNSLLTKVRDAFNCVNRMRKTNKEYREAVKAYLRLGERILGKVETTIAELGKRGVTPEGCEQAFKIKHFFDCGTILADQIERRLLRDEKIPHAEKIFSVFEPHTRWISKGKAGTPVELGVPVCVMEDQYQFILGSEIMWEGGDREAIGPLLTACQTAWPELRQVSLDRGFWSPATFEMLSSRLDLVALPKKGRCNREEAAREADPAFVAARKRHPGIESAINMLEQHGMDRILSFGADGFARMVGLSVVAANLIQIGRVQQKEAWKNRKRQGRRLPRLAA